MKSNPNHHQIFVDVDVSKSSLDVYRFDTNVVIQIENEVDAIAELCSQLEKKKRKVMVVRDSGKKSGKRFISGGRGQVRRVLYMATIVAGMRKFITILNLLLKTDQMWQNIIEHWSHGKKIPGFGAGPKYA